MITISQAYRFLLLIILAVFALHANIAEANPTPNYIESEVRDYHLPDLFLVPNQKKSSFQILLGEICTPSSIQTP
jgi:hypothetical protein